MCASARPGCRHPRLHDDPVPVEVGFEPDLTGEAGGEHTEAHIDDTVMVVTDDLGEVGAGNNWRPARARSRVPMSHRSDRRR